MARKTHRVKAGIAIYETDRQFTRLGGEVAMEETFRVKVAHAFGRVASDLHAHLPR